MVDLDVASASSQSKMSFIDIAKTPLMQIFVNIFHWVSGVAVNCFILVVPKVSKTRFYYHIEDFNF